MTWLDRRLKDWVFPTESVGDLCYEAADIQLLGDAANVCLLCDTKVGLSGYSRDGRSHTYWKSDSFDPLWKNISIYSRLFWEVPQILQSSLSLPWPYAFYILSQDTVWYNSQIVNGKWQRLERLGNFWTVWTHGIKICPLVKCVSGNQACRCRVNSQDADRVSS